MGRYDTFSDLKDRVEDGLKDHTDSFQKRAVIGDALNAGQWNLYMLLHGKNIGMFFNPVPTTITIDSSATTWDVGKAFGSIDAIIAVEDADKYRNFKWCSRHAEEFRMLQSLPVAQLYDPAEFLYDVVGDQSLMIVPRALTAFDINVYTMDEPPEMSADSDVPTLKLLFREWIIEYALQKLKGQEESGEYTSHAQLVQFLTTNINNYTRQRGNTNNGTVSEFEG